MIGKCPHCGSTKGLQRYYSLCNILAMYDYNGNHEEDCMDEASIIAQQDYLYCQSCGEAVYKLDDLRSQKQARGGVMIMAKLKFDSNIHNIAELEFLNESGSRAVQHEKLRDLFEFALRGSGIHESEVFYATFTIGTAAKGYHKISELTYALVAAMERVGIEPMAINIDFRFTDEKQNTLYIDNQYDTGDTTEYVQG